MNHQQYLNRQQCRVSCNLKKRNSILSSATYTLRFSPKMCQGGLHEQCVGDLSESDVVVVWGINIRGHLLHKDHHRNAYHPFLDVHKCIDIDIDILSRKWKATHRLLNHWDPRETPFWSKMSITRVFKSTSRMECRVICPKMRKMRFRSRKWLYSARYVSCCEVSPEIIYGCFRK